MFYEVKEGKAGEWFLDSVADTIEKYEPLYREKLDKLAPYAQRKKIASKTNALLDKIAVSNNKEDRAIEKALGWAKWDFTYHNNRFYTQPGCTTWGVNKFSSPTGCSIVHKNRDKAGQSCVSLKIYKAGSDRYKIMTVGDLWSAGTCGVMNEKGLVMTMNDGHASWQVNTRQETVSSAYFMRLVAEKCASVEEAVILVKKLYSEKIVRSSDIFFICDPDRVIVMECTPESMMYCDIEYHFEARANQLILPGMRSLGFQEKEKYLDGAERRYTASEELRTRLEKRKNHIFAFDDFMQVARHRNKEMEALSRRQICQKNTISSMLFAPDREHPEILSTLFLALGPVRHTVFLPVPFCLRYIPRSLVNAALWSSAFDRRERMGLDHNKVEELFAWERKMLSRYKKSHEKAAELLREGKKEESILLLETFFLKEYSSAEKFLHIL